MDMAVAYLFKHKIRFTLDREVTDQYEPHAYRKGRHYVSIDIENAESIGVNNASDLCTTLLKPFVLHSISTVVHEEENQIDDITIALVFSELYGEYEDYELVYYHFDYPQAYTEFFSIHSGMNIYTFPEHLLNEPFRIWVNVFCYFISDELREYQVLKEINQELRDLDEHERIRIEQERRTIERDPLPPPVESYRQERCVICLESDPSILYLDCMHIAVCVSCDNRKRNALLRNNNCDVCRAEISRRIKI